MRSLVVGLGVGLAAISQGPLGAEEPFYAPATPPRPSATAPAVTSSGLPRTLTPEQLIYERAAFRARQRIARLERNEWLGISPYRPAVTASPYFQGLNGEAWYNWSYGATLFVGPPR